MIFKPTTSCLSKKKSRTKFIIKTLIFLFGTSAFSFPSEDSLLPLNSKITISINKTVTIGEPKVKISGIITDKAGMPLPGANVLEKGTKNSTQSDIAGNFSINVKDKDAVLIISYLGFLTNEFPLKGQESITIVLLEEAATLNEVVLIGYGSQSQKKVTGAIAKIDATKIAQVATANLDQALVGAIAGVTVNQSSARPGQDANIVIRGVGTLTAGSQPLIVVDGFPLTEGSTLSSVNPDDVASLEVLKDASAAAIYGSRGANGVILITTKKGKNGEMKIGLNSYSGFQQRGNDKLKLVNAYDAAQYFKEARDWGYVVQDPENRSESDDNITRIVKGADIRQLNFTYTEPYLNNEPGLTNTDWYNDVIFRDAIMYNTTLSLSGGNEKTSYYASGGLFNQEGIVIGSAFKKFTLNTKIKTRISDKIDFGVNINTTYSLQDYVENDGSWGDQAVNGSSSSPDPISTGMLMFPFFSPKDAAGNIIVSEQIIKNGPQDGALAENILAMIETNTNTHKSFRTFGNFYFDIDIVDGLTFKTSNGLDYRNFRFDFYTPSKVGKYRTPASDKIASATETNIIAENFLTENTLNYTKQIGDHHFEVLVGQTYQQEERQKTDTDAIGFVDDKIRNVSGGSSFNMNFDRSKWTLLSYLGRISYDFKSKYLLSYSLRTDGSSRFGNDTKWGVFPSISAGWLISNESFFAIKEVVSLAKLRLSWGENGNNQIGNYSSQALIGSYNYVFGNSLTPGFSTSTAPNPDLSWETNTSYNIGIDLGFFNNKLNLTANYYNSNTTDLLLKVPVPQQSGFDESLQNIGEVLNRGFEFELAAKNIELGKFKIGLNANIATNYNEVLALGNGQNEIVTGSNSVFRTKVGGPISEMYGYQVVGIFKSEGEINRYAHLDGTNVGDYWLADANGDGKINEEDKLGFGTYAPKFNYAFGGNLGFESFDFSFSFVGVEGRKIYDRMLTSFLEYGEGFSLPSQDYFDNRYHPVNNPDGIYARPNTNLASSTSRSDARASNLFFKNADYLRLQSLQLGYSLNKKQLSRIGLEQMRIYFLANNVFTFTDFKGFNPDATRSEGDDPLRQGDAFANTPIPRSFVMGVNLIFKQK